jgi:hypothetical protein
VTHETSVFPVLSEGPPHLVASYDTQGDVEDLFYSDPHRYFLGDGNGECCRVYPSGFILGTYKKCVHITGYAYDIELN